MASTQTHLPIEDILEDTVILKDGSMAIILETSAVNFGLLSENEQLAIISSFAGLINSLSFAIQIVIRSKRLDITHYLSSLEKAQKKQTNKLLYMMIDRYRQFIKDTVRENEVLDKQFLIVIPLSFLEVGIRKDIKGNFKKAMTILIPRRDHLIRQLARTGLRARQLSSEELVKLFYDIYNGIPIATPQPPESTQPQQASRVEAAPIKPQAPVQPPAPVTPPPAPTLSQANPAPQKPIPPSSQKRTGPFIVEELPDDFSTV